MPYIATKTIKGHGYNYLVKSVRKGDTVKQVFLKYLGRGDKLTTTTLLLERSISCLVRVFDSAGQLKRLEDTQGRPLAIFEGDKVSLTGLGSRKLGKVKSKKLTTTKGRSQL